MRLIATLVKLVLFVMVLAFAVKNTEVIAIRWYFDQEWRAPLVFVVLGAFAAGVVVGLLMTVAPFLRTKLELGRLRRAERQARATAEREILASDDFPASPVLPSAADRPVVVTSGSSGAPAAVPRLPGV